MLEAHQTVYFIIGFMFFFGVIIPLLNKLVKLSLTWSLVVIYLAILCGVIFDFSHLTNEVRIILAVGSILVTVSYIYSLTCQEASCKGEKLPTPEVTLENKNHKLSFRMIRSQTEHDMTQNRDSNQERSDTTEQPTSEIDLYEEIDEIPVTNEPIRHRVNSQVISIPREPVQRLKTDPNEITAIPGVTSPNEPTRRRVSSASMRNAPKSP